MGPRESTVPTDDERAPAATVTARVRDVLRAESARRTLVVLAAGLAALALAWPSVGRPGTPFPTPAPVLAAARTPAPTSAPATTPCTRVAAPPPDTAVDTVLDRERGVLTYTFLDPANGVDRAFSIDYEHDATCRHNPRLAKLIDHTLEAAADGAAPADSPSTGSASEPRAAPTCRGADLRLHGVDTEGAGGHLGRFVHVVNVGRGECTVRGVAALTALDSSGTRIRIPTEDGTFFDGADVAQRPATIQPGDWAALAIETSVSCDAAAATEPTTYRRLQIRLPDGTAFEVAAKLVSTCPIRVGTWYRAT